MKAALLALVPVCSDAYMLAYLGEPPAKRTSVLDDSCYNATWPNVYNCRKWWTNETHRFVEGNSIPDHNEHGDNGRVIGPYCPFGENDPRGYCLPAEGTCVFAGMVCPNQTLATKLNLSGDVPVTNQIYREFTLNPDPTADDLPKHLYHGATEYQQIGVHLNGVHIKGPSEAEGYNVDTSWIPLLCGGHVTPPVGPGPVYHYHKASTCDHIETPGEHGPLLGYANDGFGIYGFQDISGTAPVVDECNGHFGPVTNADLETVFYHYHAHELTVMPSLTFTKQEPLFQPYFIGCQGPSKGKCNSTIAKAPKMMTDLYHNWCGVGCGAELCVQPGTSNSSLTTYLTKFDKGMDWIRSYTTNDYTICPECYRQNANRTAEKLPAPASREQIKRSARQLCKICDTGVCSHCQGCRDSKKGHCAGCHSGGCLPACDNCWEDILV